MRYGAGPSQRSQSRPSGTCGLSLDLAFGLLAFVTDTFDTFLVFSIEARVLFFLFVLSISYDSFAKETLNIAVASKSIPTNCHPD